MKITLIISALNAGGAERVMTTLANAWIEQEKEVSLITFQEPNYRPFYSLNPKVRLHNLNLKVSKHRYCPSFFLGLWKLLKRAFYLRRFFKQQKPDVIISFLETVNITTLLATAGLSLRVIVSERIDPRYHTIGFFQEQLRKITYPLASTIVVQTNAVQAYFSKKLAAKIVIIPNPVILHNPETLKPNYTRKMMVAVGRLDKQKGFDLLLRAFKSIDSKIPDWALTIWGDGVERTSLEQLRKSLKLDDRVLLPGTIKNITEGLSQASLFIMSSRYEGFPNSLCEAMSFGLPVIAFDCGSGPADIIRPEKDGLLVPAQNIEALSKAMLTLAESSDLRQRYGTSAQEILNRFSLSNVLKQWEAIM